MVRVFKRHPTPELIEEYGAGSEGYVKPKRDTNVASALEGYARPKRDTDDEGCEGNVKIKSDTDGNWWRWPRRITGRCDDEMPDRSPSRGRSQCLICEDSPPGGSATKPGRARRNKCLPGEESDEDDGLVGTNRGSRPKRILRIRAKITDCEELSDFGESKIGRCNASERNVLGESERNVRRGPERFVCNACDEPERRNIGDESRQSVRGRCGQNVCDKPERNVDNEPRRGGLLKSNRSSPANRAHLTSSHSSLDLFKNRSDDPDDSDTSTSLEDTVFRGVGLIIAILSLYPIWPGWNTFSD